MQIYPSGVCIFLAGIWKKQQQQQNKLTNHWDSRGEVREKEEGERKGKGEERREERTVSLCACGWCSHISQGLSPLFPGQQDQHSQYKALQGHVRRMTQRGRWDGFVEGHPGPKTTLWTLPAVTAGPGRWIFHTLIKKNSALQSLNPSGSGNPCSYVFPLFPQLF